MEKTLPKEYLILSISEPKPKINNELYRGCEILKDGSLVQYTKSASLTVNNKLTKIEGSDKETEFLQQARRKRYELQGAARELFLQEARRMIGVGEVTFKTPYDLHRTSKCMLVRHGQVAIHKSLKYERAFYSGLVQCGSVWSCPVCANKIQERRRVEVCKAMEWAYREGYKCLLVTFTFPHYSFQKCKDLAEKLTGALRFFRSGGTWKGIKEEIGFEGMIRGLEVTYGKNGWHPHTHEIWIVSQDCNVEALKAKILKRWERCCKKFGLLPENRTEAFKRNAVDVIDNASTSDYLVKTGKREQVDIDGRRHWGTDREVVRASVKGDSSGKSPFSLLESYKAGDQESGEKFLEYSFAFKGKAQLFWSQGLKARVGLADKTDEELVKEKEDQAELAVILSNDEWRVVVKYKAIVELLEITEIDGGVGVRRWCFEHT